jgi:hypothetical protein
VPVSPDAAATVSVWLRFQLGRWHLAWSPGRCKTTSGRRGATSSVELRAVVGDDRVESNLIKAEMRRATPKSGTLEI